jgi:hypothetical protein
MEVGRHDKGKIDAAGKAISTPLLTYSVLMEISACLASRQCSV